LEDLASTSRSVFVARLDAALTSATATCAILSSLDLSVSVFLGLVCPAYAWEVVGDAICA